MSFCTSLRNFIQIGPHSAEKMTSHRFSKWRISAILNFRGPIMGSLKSPCTTSCRSSIDTIALNWLVFEKILFFWILATDRETDRQTNRQTDEQMDSIDALSRSCCREQRLNNNNNRIYIAPWCHENTDASCSLLYCTAFVSAAFCTHNSYFKCNNWWHAQQTSPHDPLQGAATWWIKRHNACLFWKFCDDSCKRFPATMQTNIVIDRCNKVDYEAPGCLETMTQVGITNLRQRSPAVNSWSHDDTSCYN